MKSVRGVLLIELAFVLVAVGATALNFADRAQGDKPYPPVVSEKLKPNWVQQSMVGPIDPLAPDGD